MSDQKEKNAFTQFSAFRIASLAILIAVTTIFTYAIRIPTAPTRGYLNFGDVAVFFTAITFGPFSALVAGGLGTALADIISGYTQWAPITFFAHGIQGFVVGLIIFTRKKNSEDHHIGITRLILAFLGATFIMAGTYFVTGGFMYGFGAAATEIPGNILQNVAGILIGYPLALAVRKAYPPVLNYKW